MIQIDQGFAIFQHVFPPAEMAGVVEHLALDRPQRSKAGARHLLNVPVVRAISGDPRLLDIARTFVGQEAVAFRATLFDKSPTANWLVVWHQDTALPLRARVEGDAWGPWSNKAGVLYAHAPAWALQQIVALRVSLDDSTMTNGPLRVLPERTGAVFIATNRSKNWPGPRQRSIAWRRLAASSRCGR